jgi:pimeloyl-ACP methyl ester carboxylesterase
VPGAASPHDRVTLKICYPALPDDGEEQRNAGVVPADSAGSPYPVVVFMPGINIGPESYAWLASRLALAGIVTVTYTYVAEEMPGFESLTPGLDLSAITPGEYGTRPSASVLPAIFRALEVENGQGVLGGVLDTDRVILAGHSGGGSVALFNSNPDWFPQVRGAIAYGAHGAAATMLGFPENTILRLADAVPLLLIGGTRDGVIAASAARYGDEPGEPLQRIRDTFDRGIEADRGDCYLVEIEGANHFSMAWPQDETTGRAFLDWSEEADGDAIRDLVAALVERFVTSGNLDEFSEHELVASLRQK